MRQKAHGLRHFSPIYFRLQKGSENRSSSSSSPSRRRENGANHRREVFPHSRFLRARAHSPPPSLSNLWFLAIRRFLPRSVDPEVAPPFDHFDMNQRLKLQQQQAMMQQVMLQQQQQQLYHSGVLAAAMSQVWLRSFCQFVIFLLR